MPATSAKARPWESGDKPGKAAKPAELPEAKAPATAPKGGKTIEQMRAENPNFDRDLERTFALADHAAGKPYTGPTPGDLPAPVPSGETPVQRPEKLKPHVGYVYELTDKQRADELARVRKAKTESEEIETELKKILGRDGLRMIEGGAVNIEIVEVSTSRLDTTAIKAALTDAQLERFTKHSTERRFNVKPRV